MFYARIPEEEYLTRARNTGEEASVYPEWLKLLSTLPSTVSPSLVPKPLSSEFGTYKTVKARLWPWHPGKSTFKSV